MFSVCVEICGVGVDLLKRGLRTCGIGVGKSDPILGTAATSGLRAQSFEYIILFRKLGP